MDQVQRALLVRYAHLHSLLFQRSLEKAKTNGELFDILEGIPDTYPVVWDEASRQWMHTDDLLQSNLSHKKENSEQSQAE